MNEAVQLINAVHHEQQNRRYKDQALARINDAIDDCRAEQGWVVVCADGISRHPGYFDNTTQAYEHAQGEHGCTAPRSHNIVFIELCHECGNLGKLLDGVCAGCRTCGDCNVEFAGHDHAACFGEQTG